MCYLLLTAGVKKATPIDELYEISDAFVEKVEQ